MLTFKRGNNDTLNNTPITKDMLYFTTDDNSIYMDTSDMRYKIFGINGTNDTASSVHNTSKNTYFDKNSHLFLTKNDVAINGNTTDKIAIGQGYYNNIIGNNYEDYYDQPITSVINRWQNYNPAMTQIWTNEDVTNTWSSSLSLNQSSNEYIDINIPQSYALYIVVVQQYVTTTVSEDGIYLIMINELPKSLATITRKTYGAEYHLRNGEGSNLKKSIVYGELWCEIMSSSNSKKLRITKLGHLVEDEGSMVTPNDVDYQNYLVPIALYGMMDWIG